MPMRIVLPNDDGERRKIYSDYAGKLEYVFGVIVYISDSEFVIKTVSRNTETYKIQFGLAHLILKSHNLENKDIEVYE